MVYRDLIQLAHFADLGMSEMIGQMRLHVQEVTRYTTMISLKLKLSDSQAGQFHNDCKAYGLDFSVFLENHGKNYGFTPAGIFLVKICAKIHDIGKPFFRNIYSQERPLNHEEFESQKLHANLSRIIVKSLALDKNNNFEKPELIQFVADMAAAHQEKFDGTGYPDGKAGQGIGLIGRLLAITDAISAMVNPRPYNEPVSLFTCLKRIKESAGTHFDPDLLQTVNELLQTGKFTEERFSGHWNDLEKFSEDYLSFIRMINLEKITLCKGDTEHLAELKKVIKDALDLNR